VEPSVADPSCDLGYLLRCDAVGDPFDARVWPCPNRHRMIVPQGCHLTKSRPQLMVGPGFGLLGEEDARHAHRIDRQIAGRCRRRCNVIDRRGVIAA
jgi:hypothetical protein